MTRRKVKHTLDEQPLDVKRFRSFVLFYFETCQSKRKKNGQGMVLQTPFTMKDDEKRRST